MIVPVVRGKTIDSQTRCVHYRTRLDIIAIKFRCCGEYYPCHLCHEECAGHPSTRWRLDEYDHKAILCGACSTELTIAEYRAAEECPSCSATFNPRCALHAHLYFVTG
jgi:uncharacterized CHY-type Zn-finger protein